MFLPRLLWTASVSSHFWLLGWCSSPVTGRRTLMGHTICTDISCYHFFSHLSPLPPPMSPPFLCHQGSWLEWYLDAIFCFASSLTFCLIYSPWLYLSSCSFLHTGRGSFFFFSLCRQSCGQDLPQLLLCSLMPPYVPPMQIPLSYHHGSTVGFCTSQGPC